MSMKSLLRIFGQPAQSSQAAPIDAFTLDDLIIQGNGCEDRGDHAKALEIYQRAVALSPDSARAHLNLGNAHCKIGQNSRALACYRHAATLLPDWLPPHLNLGALLLRLPDATAAEASYREAVRLAPESADAWIGLGCALDEQGADAESAFRKALELAPGHAGAASRLSQWLRTQGRAKDALDVLHAALVSTPDDIALLRILAEIQAGVGEYAAACAADERILAQLPQEWETHGHRLWTLNFMPEADAGKLLAEHEKFGELMQQVVPPGVEAPCQRNRARLKVGYVSGDFRRHSVSCFMEPLLRHHDRGRFEVHCFYNYPTGDDITQKVSALADHWHDIAGMSDDEVARRIRDNGIDILVDLAGHTAYSRLGVFARKPVPLQITWLGYLCTTGLRAIDYRLCDAYTDPPGLAEAWQVETPMRLPNSQWCYAPQVELPPSSPLPRLGNGHWTFGSFNQESKLNEPALHAWAKILRAVPDSRLRVLGVSCDLVEEKIHRIFTEHGVDAGRIDLVGRLPIDAYFAAYRDVDIALDTFPYNGATTTCDALLMGVPVAGVAGDRAIARGGVSLLTSVGLQDWIAPSPDALVEVVSDHIADQAAVADLRLRLPERMRASPLMDGDAFARDVEAAFERAWRQT